MKIYRVVVRGQFADLDETTRSRLLDDAEEHHFLRSAFTADGTLTYDEQLVAFNFRYEVRQTADDPSENAIGDAATERTIRTLQESGVGYKRLRVTVTDMATMWD